MKSLKTIFTFAFICCALVALPQEKGVTAVYTSNVSVAQSTKDGKTVSEFQLKASKEHIGWVTAQLVNYDKYLTLDMEEQTPGLYQCTMTIDYECDKRYIHKMLRAFKVENFQYDGQNHKIDQFVSTVK